MTEAGVSQPPSSVGDHAEGGRFPRGPLGLQRSVPHQNPGGGGALTKGDPAQARPASPAALCFGVTENQRLVLDSKPTVCIPGRGRCPRRAKLPRERRPCLPGGRILREETGGKPARRGAHARARTPRSAHAGDGSTRTHAAQRPHWRWEHPHARRVAPMRRREHAHATQRPRGNGRMRAVLHAHWMTEAPCARPQRAPRAALRVRSGDPGAREPQRTGMDELLSGRTDARRRRRESFRGYEVSGICLKRQNDVVGKATRSASDFTDDEGEDLFEDWNTDDF